MRVALWFVGHENVSEAAFVVASSYVRPCGKSTFDVWTAKSVMKRRLLASSREAQAYHYA